MADFEPVQGPVRITAGAGKYVELYTPDTFAIWIDPEVAAKRRQRTPEGPASIDPALDQTAAYIDERFYVIECHLTSAFEDPNIAFDAINLRSMIVYLQSPDGRRAFPIQRILEPHAGEEQMGTLTRFHRKVLIVFPKTDTLAGQSAISPSAEAVRLVIEGFSSRYFFEWQSETGVASPPIAVYEDGDHEGFTFHDIYSQLSPLTTYLQ